MGWIKDKKVQAMQQEATAAHQAGQWVFVARINMPGFQTSFSGEVKDWSLMIQAVEESGWYLDRMSTNSDNSGRPDMVALFRRRPEHA